MEDETISLAGAPRGSPLGAIEADPSLAELYRKHQLELVRLAWLMTGDLAAAEDIVQDVFERMHRRWARLHDRSSTFPYARAAVINGCRSAFRRSAMARSKEILAADRFAPDPAATCDDSALVMAALRRLPRRQLEVLVLRYYLDLDAAEIAKALRIGTPTVRSTTSRALASLATALRED
jgi:RNA polymerase sigma-70 factor (sigma-E family)